MSTTFDTIGYWSELKLDIVKQYATAYSTILAAQKPPGFHHAYIDAFAGSGRHISKRTGEFVLGSPLNALAVHPPFKEYHLIDLDSNKIAALREATKGRPDVNVYEGDCNQILLDTVFSAVRYEDYRRALCLLDPYGLHLRWEVIKRAGRSGTIELFLNFPVADINRNVLRRNPEAVDPEQASRLNAYWGDESWRQIAYTKEGHQGNLFGFDEKTSNNALAEGFRSRLIQSAGFQHVPPPLPMRNTKAVIVYYLFFAAHKPVAADIVKDIFKKYQSRGER